MRSAFSLVVVALVLIGPAAQSQESASVREMKVEEILASCEGASVAEIWLRARELSDMGRTVERILRRSIGNATIEGKLAGLRALIDLDSVTYAAEKLETLAADETLDERFRLLAIELIGMTEEPDAEDALLELLVGYNARIKLAAARALWRLDTPNSHRAKVTLREFLASADPELQAEGAIALAEIGDADTPGVTDILYRLRREPGMRGQLATALLRKLQLEKSIQIHQRNAEAAGGGKGSPLWRHLDEIRKRLAEAYDLEQNIDDDLLRARAARGMTSFPDDPHTTFMTPEQYHEFLHGAEGVDPSYGGIGAFIDTNSKDRFRILRPIFNGPAWKARIKGGDYIVAVNGEPTAGRETTEIIKQIKGPAGTPVVLTIFRDGWAEGREFTVIRAKIVLPTVTSRMLPGKIGYVTLAQFAFETAKELREHLVRLEAEGMRALVIDVRDNPGGLLPTVKGCLTLFLKERELICTVKGRVYRPEKHVSGRPDRARAYPISVLVNNRSASGSELLSGVLQHYSKNSEIGGATDPYLDALVVGAETFGKGTVQHTIPLSTWAGETFVDLPRRNGRFDYGEPFEDRNKNRRWDPGEPFEDRPLKNGRWDDAERWEDLNGNGTRDRDESFTDENGDGTWNPAEAFDDLNRNDRYDTGAALKLTIARYYLPGGRNFTRQRTFEEGKYVYKGGVIPDIATTDDEMKVAHLVELREMQEEGLFRAYLDPRWVKHAETFRKLAFFDARDPSLYPDFEEFYEGLKTRLDRQAIRRALRIEVRREVANELGKEILGDLSDDATLRAGVRSVLKRLGVDPDSIAEYRSLNGNSETPATK
jgi:carboxyl-terminal processing protease